MNFQREYVLLADVSLSAMRVYLIKAWQRDHTMKTAKHSYMDMRMPLKRRNETGFRLSNVYQSMKYFECSYRAERKTMTVTTVHLVRSLLIFVFGNTDSTVQNKSHLRTPKKSAGALKNAADEINASNK